MGVGLVGAPSLRLLRESSPWGRRKRLSDRLAERVPKGTTPPGIPPHFFLLTKSTTNPSLPLITVGDTDNNSNECVVLCDDHLIFYIFRFSLRIDHGDETRLVVACSVSPARSKAHGGKV